MSIQIDLSEKIINARVDRERTGLSEFLRERGSSIENIESQVGDRNFGNILRYMAVMGIEIETALNYAREGNVESVARLLAGAKVTKDQVYGELMVAYGFADRSGRMLGMPKINGDLALWRDYLVYKFDGALKVAELRLSTSGVLS